MNRKRALSVGVVIAATAVVLALVPAQAAPPPQQPPAQDVTVINTADNPVPVTAAQRGSWTVGIEGTPNVNVANFPAPTPPALWQGTPYVREVQSLEGCVNPAEFEIPAGMVLFVERATTSGVGFNSAFFFVSTLPSVILTPLGDRPRNVRIPGSAARLEDAPNDVISFAGTLELGVPVTQISACAESSFPVTVIGYLVPAPVDE